MPAATVTHLFQSQSGAIRGVPVMAGKRAVHRFNPSLVRLEAYLAGRYRRKPDRFQSQSGAIRGLPTRRTNGRQGQVSIPVWCD